jgi:SAM-dependent methyltransferase
MAELRPDGSPDGTTFGAEYYATSCGKPYCRNEEWLGFFGAIADRIVADMHPRRVLDAGCALGLLVETLRARDVEAFGLDISSYAVANADPGTRPYLREGSVAGELDGRYDLIVSIEVLEHMPAADAETAIANFCRHTDDVLFSSSPLDYSEATHVNVRPPEYWAEQFARHGFVRDVDFDASFITPWAVRFRRTADPLHRIVADYERRHAPVLRERAEVRAHLVVVQDELQRVNLELLATQARVAAERDTIAHMERSAFWRARVAWRRVINLMGGLLSGGRASDK